STLADTNSQLLLETIIKEDLGFDHLVLGKMLTTSKLYRLGEMLMCALFMDNTAPNNLTTPYLVTSLTAGEPNPRE
ncbi:unnamed protein product, partial [Ilex paraguariensis]